MSKRPSQSSFLVGAAQVDITPPLSVPYLAHLHDNRHRSFEGIHDRLSARAVVVGDGEHRIALLVSDSIGFARGIMGPDRDFTQEVRRRIERRCGIAPDRIMLCATHAHSTPETIGFRSLLDHPGAAEWLETLADRLAEAAVSANDARKPMRLRTVKGRVERVGESRRLLGKDGQAHMRWSNPPADSIAEEGPDDPELTVLCFQSAEGVPEIVLVHFTCHPVAVQAQPLISADFPGVVAARITAAGIGCRQCMFLQGAAGSIDPVRMARGFDDVESSGQILADAAVKLLRSAGASDGPTAPAELGAAGEVIRLPSRELPTPASVEDEVRAGESVLNLAATEADRDAARSNMMALLEKRERVRGGKVAYDAEVQVFRIGDVALVGIPGEPFVELGLELKRSGAAPTTLCLGYANDYLGYIAPPSAWAQGGYEVSLGMWSIVGPAAFDRILAGTRKLVHRLFGSAGTSCRFRAVHRTERT